jgi:hypothetical protein
VTDVDQLTALCVKLGAENKQAATMAAQLLKRADQLAVERGVDRTVALGYLVELMIKSRAGEPPPEFPLAMS